MLKMAMKFKDPQLDIEVLQAWQELLDAGYIVCKPSTKVIDEYESTTVVVVKQEA